MIKAAALLLVAATPALGEDWLSFSMGEGPDLKLDRSSIRKDSEGEIAPWGKGWMTAKTMTREYGQNAPGYFVTDCRDLYYVFRVNPQTGSIEDGGAQPLHVAPGAIAQQIQSIVCSGGK